MFLITFGAVIYCTLRFVQRISLGLLVGDDESMSDELVYIDSLIGLLENHT